MIDYRSLLITIFLLFKGSLLFADFKPDFFAFQNGVSFGSYKKNAQTLKEIGYVGVSQVHVKGEALEKLIIAYEKLDMKVLSVYLDILDQPIQEKDVKPLQNRGAMIELTVRKMNSLTIKAIQTTAEMASKLNIRVALYPHHGFAVATMPEALDMVKKVDHPNFGVMFNLCHFLKNEKVDDLKTLLTQAGNKLFAVSTSGGDINGKNWSQLIQTLDRGNFPQKQLFAILKDLNFTGPVGLQCYAIKGDKRKNLETSMAAWKLIHE